MAHIDVDKALVIDMYSDDIKKVLQDLMMAELDKDEKDIDTAFVDECVDALLEIEKEESGFVSLVPLLTSEQFLSKITGANALRWKNLNRFTRVAVVAAVLAGSTFTANAAVEAVTGVNIISQVGTSVQNKLQSLGIIKTTGIDVVDGEDEDDDIIEEATTVQATTEQATEPATEETTTAAPTTTQTTNRHIDVLDGEDDDEDETTTRKPTTTKKPNIDVLDGEDDDETTTRPTTTEPSTVKPVVPTTVENVANEPDIKPTPDDKEPEIKLVALEADFDGFKTNYVYGEELSYDGLILHAVYSDGSKKRISIDDCTYTKRVDMTKTADYTLTVFYLGCDLEIQITVRPDENTRGAGVYSNEDYEYLLTDEGAYITMYKGSDTRINLDEVDGNKVIAICANVFEGKNIEMINAQEAKIIYNNAFKDCESLIDCFIPSAESIGDSAFENCTSLKTAVFSHNLSHIGKRAYRNTAIKDIVIPEGITVIPEKMLEDCASLTEVTLEGAVTEIEKDAFSNCEALEMVYGTEYIVKVGEKAFFYDTKVNFGSKPSRLENVGAYAFSNCNSLDFGPLNNIKTFDMGSFEYCWLLKEITIPAGTREIPDYSLIGTRLESITLPDGLVRIGEYALSATMIKEITLPKSLDYIGNMGLYITRLREVTFECRHLEICDNAFYNSTRIKFYVHNKSSAMDYAIANDIDYVLLEEEFYIPTINGEDDD